MEVHTITSSRSFGWLPSIFSWCVCLDWRRQCVGALLAVPVLRYISYPLTA